MGEGKLSPIFYKRPKMLKNFVTDSYLERYFPDIINYRRGGQNDYTNAIAQAFDVVLDDLSNRGINPRLCMIPIDLCRDENTNPQIQKLVSQSTASQFLGYAWKGNRERRWVTTVTSGTGVFTLQGSNLSSRPTDNDATWEDIQTINYVDETTVTNVTITTMYKWYRLKVVPGETMVFTSAIYETQFDKLIAFRALELISAGWKTGQNSMWDSRKDDMKREYDAQMESIKFGYDANEDGVPDDSETKQTAGVRFTR